MIVELRLSEMILIVVTTESASPAAYLKALILRVLVEFLVLMTLLFVTAH